MSAHTPWFPADVKPARNGKYQVRNVVSGDPFHGYWNNGKWRFSNRSNAAKFRHQEREWRGLAKKP